MQSLRAVLSGFSLLLLSLLLASCGGGGSGVFTDNRLALEVFVEKASVPVNMVQDPIGPGSPYVSEVAVRVRDNGSGQPVEGATVNVSFIGAQVGGLLTEQDFFTGQGIPRPAVNAASDGGGWVRVYFVAAEIAGQAQLRIRADRPGGAPQTGADASTVIQVVSTAGPPSAIEFTGPYIDAIRTNRVQFGLAPGETFDFQNGTYSRVISVTVNDASGNPVPVNTPIRFHLIDAPLQGFPDEGSGFFTLRGLGDPLEGGYLFDAPGGNFLAQGARAGDRLVLFPHPDDSSFFHAGIRTIAGYPLDRPNRLLIRTDEQPFRVGPNFGPVVPYTVGRARAGSIQSLAFTDTNGVASTLLTYPFSNLGRTAILVAHTQDYSVSRVFNPGGPVYLGVVGENFSLTVSPTVLPSNVNDGFVWLCVRDQNFVPLPGTWIAFSTSGSTGAAVDVNGLGPSGFIETGAGGCALAVVNVIGQIPSENIRIGFKVNALDEEREVEVSVLAPSTATLLGSPNCEAGTLDMTYLTDGAQPIPGAVITAGNVQWPSGTPGFVFDPPADAGASAGITNDAGSVSVGFTLGAAGGSYEATFQADRGEGRYDLACLVAVPPIPEVNLVGNAASLPPGGSTALAVVLDSPAVEKVTVNVLTTGDTEHFTVLEKVDIDADSTSVVLPVAAKPGAPNGASVQVRLVPGTGYALGANVGPLNFTVSLAAQVLPTVSLVGNDATLAPGGGTALGVVLSAPAAQVVTVNVLTTGDTEHFTVLEKVDIDADSTSVVLPVAAKPGAPNGARVEVRLVAGTGYTLGANVGPLNFTVSLAAQVLPTVSLVGNDATLAPGGGTALGVVLSAPAAQVVRVNVLTTGDTEHFTVLEEVDIDADSTSVALPVTAKPGAPNGARVEVRLVAGTGYTLGANVGPLNFTVSLAAQVLPTVSLVGNDATLAPGGGTALGVVLSAPAAQVVRVNVLTTGDTEHFTVLEEVDIDADSTSVALPVTAKPGAPNGARVEVRLVAGTGYTLGANVGPRVFTVSVAAEALPVASLIGSGTSLAPGAGTNLAVTLNSPAPGNVTLNVLRTGDTGQITVQQQVTILDGQTSAPLPVAAIAGALNGAAIEVRLVAGAGYTVGTPSGPLTFTVNDALSDLPRAVLTSPGLLSTGLVQGDEVTLSVTLDRPAAFDTVVNVLATGTNIDRFRLMSPNPANPIPAEFSVTVEAGSSTQDLVVRVRAVTVQGELNLQLTSGLGYTLAGTTSNVITLRTVSPP